MANTEVSKAGGGGDKRGGRRLGKGLGALLAAEPVRVSVPSRSEPTKKDGPTAPHAADPRADPAPINRDDEPTLAGHQTEQEAQHARPQAFTGPHTDPAGPAARAESAEGPSQERTDAMGPPIVPAAAGGLRMLPLDSIVPNRYQPRSAVEESGLESLAASIARDGVLQPIVVRPLAGLGGDGAVARFELVAGERRWRASAIAGLDRVPAIVRVLSDGQAAELALVENLQREDLNVVDRARALSALATGFGLTQAEVAERVGLDRSSVTNLLRLLELEASVLDLLASGALSGGHGKALLSAASGTTREALAARAVEEQWSVRETEQRARAAGLGAKESAKEPEKDASARSAAVGDLEKRLADYLGTRVAISTNASGTKGKVVLEFFDLDQFDGLMRRIGFERDGGR